MVNRPTPLQVNGMEAQNISKEKAPGLPGEGRQAAGGAGASLRRIPTLTEREFHALMAQAIRILEAFEEAKEGADPRAAQLVNGLARDAVTAMLAAWEVDNPPVLWDKMAVSVVSEEAFDGMDWYAFALPVLFGGKKAFVIVSTLEGSYHVAFEGSYLYESLADAFVKAGLPKEPALEVVG